MAIKRLVPRGSSFRGFPIAFNHASPSRAWCALLASPAAREIIDVSAHARARCTHTRARGPLAPAGAARKNCLPTPTLTPPPTTRHPPQAPAHVDPSHTAFALRAQVTVYPEDTMVAWVMLACTSVVPSAASLAR